jgi:hypothetical protein
MSCIGGVLEDLYWRCSGGVLEDLFWMHSWELVLEVIEGLVMEVYWKTCIGGVLVELYWIAFCRNCIEGAVMYIGVEMEVYVWS